MLTVAAPGVLGNDADTDGDPLTAVLATGPSHGSLTLNANGSFSYTPAADFAGNDSFTYRASDGTLTSNVATAAISVTGANDAPMVTVAAGGTCGSDDQSGTICLAVGGVETGATVVTLSAASSNPSLVPPGNVVLRAAATPACGQSQFFSPCRFPGGAPTPWGSGRGRLWRLVGRGNGCK